MGVVVVTPPGLLAELSLAKKHLRVDGSAEDTLITVYIAAASGHVDGPGAYLGRAVGQQVLEERVACLPSLGWVIPVGPVIGVVSVKYLDPDGVEQTLAPETYRVVDDVLLPADGQAWPTTLVAPDAVRVRWTAGYAQTPPSIVAAILLMVGDLYRNRETVVVGSSAGAIPMSTTVENLLRPFRVLEV
jgi:uncharacterized phiE125 gp8 family phage protein